MLDWKLGIIVGLEEGADAALRKVRDLGLPTCQLSVWHPELLTEASADDVRRAVAENGVEIDPAGQCSPPAKRHILWRYRPIQHETA